jgi:hypothetical protein
MAHHTDPAATLTDVWPLLLAADTVGVRLEITAGVPTWEASPVRRHQQTVDRIRASIVPPHGEEVCTCIHLADVYVRFAYRTSGVRHGVSPMTIITATGCTLTV